MRISVNFSMLELGNLKLKSNLILAPMAGVTDLPFRVLNRSFGAHLAFIEMLNCRSIGHKSIRTMEMLRSQECDRPLGVQLLGTEEKYLLRALDILAPYNFDLLDFNAACPAKKVVRRGEGSALLREPKKLQRLLSLLVKNASWPVTVKIRTGWDSSFVNAERVAHLAEDSGVKGIFIHGRTRLGGYSSMVDYNTIRHVKKKVKIPVIASGNILSGELAKKMFTETGCDGIVVARGSLGNPWIFKEISLFLKGGMVKRPSLKEIVSVMSRHLEANVAFYGEERGVLLFRKFFVWYTKGFRNIRPLRQRAFRTKTMEEIEGLIREILTKNPLNL
ncbi:MAG: tRNA dihydrouridine synthase DusB [Candidatus Omnitrophica bacterium]|nr:tRNA dihydrouridine synthase DusB [Candidatus Omnitrophota bacterium]